MKKLLSIALAVVFASGLYGVAAAQTEKKPEKAADKAEQKTADKAEKKAEKKPAAKTASGTVKSASADSIVVAGKQKGKDMEWTFAVDPKTKIKKGGKDISGGDLQAGDAVQVKYTEQDGKATAQAVTVRGPKTAKKAENPCAAKGEKMDKKAANPCAAKTDKK